MKNNQITTILILGLLLSPLVGYSQSEIPDRSATSLVKKLEASHKGISLAAKIYQNGANTFKYNISGGAPNGCYSLQSEYRAQENKIVGELTVPSEEEMCTMAIKQLESRGVINGSDLNNLKLTIVEANKEAQKEPDQNNDVNKLDFTIGGIIDYVRHAIQKLLVPPNGDSST